MYLSLALAFFKISISITNDPFRNELSIFKIQGGQRCDRVSEECLLQLHVVCFKLFRDITDCPLVYCNTDFKSSWSCFDLGCQYSNDHCDDHCNISIKIIILISHVMVTMNNFSWRAFKKADGAKQTFCTYV